MRKKHSLLRLLCGICLAAAAVLCCPSLQAADEPGYVRTVFNKSSGLPTDEANTVLQTKDGYLWVGGYGGLLRFDGTNFRNFSTEGAIATPSIRTLFQDSAGRLWVGSSDAGAFLYDDESKRFTAVPRTDKYGFLSIRDFVEGLDGTIYVASTSGVCEIQDGVMVPIEDPQVLGETVYSLGVDRYGRLWCALNGESCAILQNGRCLTVLDADDFFSSSSERITCLTSDSDHDLYLGTNGARLVRVTCTGTALDGSDFSTRVYHTSDSALYNRIRVMDAGDMLISSEQGFSWLTADGEEVDPHVSVRTSAVNWATIDYEGNVWLASSDEGLIRYTPGYFSSPNIETGLADTAINAIESAGGRFYVATDVGLLAFDSSWAPVQTPISSALSAVQAKHLMTDSRGRLWCGTYSDLGLVCYDPADGTLSYFNPETGLDSTRIRVSFEMADGTIAVGTQDGLALIRDDTVAAFYDKDNGLETQSILCLAQTPSGTLLAGSAGSGIYALTTDGQIIQYSHAQGLEDGVVLRIVPEADGKSAFVCAGSHLYYWSENTFRRFDNLEVGVGSIFDLLDRDGRLWLMQDSGLYSIDKSQLLAGSTPHATRYGVSDGLFGSLSVNTWNYMAPDGTLYLSTRHGISVFDFRAITFPIPQPIIERIRVDNQIYEEPAQLTLSRRNRRMTIDFAALSFSGTADLCIAYQLVGFARNETVLYGTSGSVSYTNLDGGTYTFRLRVFDPDDPEVQEVQQITIKKEKQLFEYPLTWLLGAVLLALLIHVIVRQVIRSKTKRLTQQRQMYRKLVGQALRTFANTIDAKDSYTNGHSVRVALYAREITRRMHYSENDQETVYYIALLHDIGKIGIPDSILNKEGSLTPEERAIVQTHPVKGAEILRDFTALKGLADGARYHHERYDGTGYCEGLAGKDIPLIGRIVCVADCYDAMSSDRCYRKGLPPEKILEELEKGSGTQFDPEIAAIMEDMIREGVVPVSASTADRIPVDGDLGKSDAH